MIGEADGYISAAVHASSSGIVTAIDLQPVPHISGLPDLCITIDTDGHDEWIEHAPLDYQAMATGRTAHAVARPGSGRPRRRGVSQRGQARPRRGAPLPHADHQRRRMRTVDHLRRHADARPRRRDPAGRGDHAAPAGQHRNPDRHRGQQARGHRRDAGRRRKNGFRGGSGDGADALSRRRRQADDPGAHRQGSAFRQAAPPISASRCSTSAPPMRWRARCTTASR